MKIVQRLARIPDGDDILPEQMVAVRRISDGQTIQTLKSDSEGYVTLSRDGHLEPYYFHLPDVPGGDKYWISTETKTAALTNLREMPLALRRAGDGVIRGIGQEFSASLVSGTANVSVGSGAAVVAGYPFVTYAPMVMLCERPSSGIKHVRIVIRLSPDGASQTPGKADLFCLEGTGGAVPSLTRNAEIYEVGLWQLAVPASGVITLTDERAYARERTTVRGEGRTPGLLTTSTSPVPVGQPLSITLPRPTIYDLTAKVTAVNKATASGWVKVLDLNPATGWNFSTSLQLMAHDRFSGAVFVCDAGNQSVYRINPDGSWGGNYGGLPSVVAVATDFDGWVFVPYRNTSGSYQLRRFNTALAFSADGSGWYPDHLGICYSTSSGYLWISEYSDARIRRFHRGTLRTQIVDPYGSIVNVSPNPYGQAFLNGEIYICDMYYNRILVVNEGTPTSMRQLTTSLAGHRVWGIAADQATNTLWLADSTDNTVRQFNPSGTLLDSFTVGSTPVGIAVNPSGTIWVSCQGARAVQKYQKFTPGYGEVALDVAGTVTPYLGIGNRDGTITNVATASVQGPATVAITAQAKALSGQLTFGDIIVRATARPRS